MQSENIINTLNKSLTSDSPNDTESDFFERLQGYIDDQKWIKKPLSLSPPICSQYGWKCIKSDLLECVTCGTKLNTHLPNIESFKAYKECIEKLINDLKDKHTKHCPWPITPSPESFVKMIIMPREEALTSFLQRLKSSLSFRTFIPYIKETTFNELDLSEEHISSLCKMGEISSEDVNQFGKSIVSLAITGWTLNEGSEAGKVVLKCNNCQRLIWPGLFKLLISDDTSSKKTNEENSAKKDNETTECELKNGQDCKESEKVSEEPPAKKKKIVIEKGEPFDPLHEHRPWCLWITDGIEEYVSISESDVDKSQTTEGTPGWKIFKKSLLRNLVDSQNLETSTPSKEQIRNVRNLLDTWNEIV